jgi:WS/DGAT/MGAT family acyltransferase
MYVVEGLEDGYIACVTKTHHAAIDGVSGAELTANLLDLSPETMWLDPAEDTWKPDRIPSDAELVGFAAQSLARQPIAAAKAVRRTAEMALNLRRRNREPNATPPPAPFSAPSTSINTAISPRRNFAFTQMSLDDVKHVKNTLGGTVNDIVLALCAGALRRFFDAKGEYVDGSLVGMIPISVRSEDEQGAMGNRVSSMLVDLATDIDDPIARLAKIREATKNAKEQDKAIGADTLTNWTEFAAPAIAARAARLYSNMKMADRHRPIFNVTISNVPGPPFPLYSAGARMIAMYPMGPIADGGALNITVMSYMDTMNFGLVACADTVPNVDDIARHLDDALDELLKLANAQ